MKILIFFLLISSCTKKMVVGPDALSRSEVEKIKWEKPTALGEKKESKNKYNIIIIDHKKNSKIEYAIPKNEKWELPVNLLPTVCATKGEEAGAKDFYFMELSCSGVNQYDLASVVACGPQDKFDAETLRILKDGDPYLTIQIRCSL